MTNNKQKSWLHIAFFVLILILIISLQVYYYNKLETKQEELETRLNTQNELILLKINQTSSAIVDLISSEKLLNEENKLELEKNILENFEKLEDYVNLKTTSLEVDFGSQISIVDEQIKNLEIKDYEIETKIDDINVKSSDFSSIIDDVIPAVVSIKTNEMQGSGFFFNKDGHIMTNRHVIEDANYIHVIDSNSQVYQAKLLAVADNVDLAVLKVESDKSFEYLKFEDDVKVGERVIALGNPLGLSFTVTEGIISATNRRIDDTGIGYIQVDVPINKGNSGGPLVNSAKKVVGVNTFKISSGEGLGFAIPSFVVEDIALQSLEE